jgi:glycosyltransferase involved in cell wall biosynthesis
MKLCVFPNDPIKSYYEKGEIKSRYFNPKNLFEEIHIISPTSKEIDEKKVQELVGNGKIKFHTIGELNLINYKSKLKHVNEIIKKIKPDVIRSYNPLLQGWLAAKTAKEFKIPFIVSIHNNYDRDNRDLFLKSKQYFKFAKFWYTSKSVEPHTIQNADKIICAYRFLVPYAKHYGGKNIDVIYNRVDLSRFSPEGNSKYNYQSPTIIYVARLSEKKNQQCLINAIAELDVKLLLVGNGPDYDELLHLVEKLKIRDKVEFIKSVPNEELATYYRSAVLFAAPIKQGGVSIPMLEAMACGIPILATNRDTNEKEDMDEAMYFSKNEPALFKKSINKLTSDKKLLSEMKLKGLEIIQHIHGDAMEQKESDIYKEVIRNYKFTQ